MTESPCEMCAGTTQTCQRCSNAASGVFLRIAVEAGGLVLPSGMTEADLLRSVLRQVLVEASSTADGGDEGV